MAKGLRAIKRKIRSMQSMKQMTKAMELVAAAKLKRAQLAAVAARPYAEKMREVISSIASGSDIRHPMLEAREIRRTGYLVLTSDRGLAGGYNANVLRLALSEIGRHASQDEYVVMVVGKKGREFFRRRKIPIAHEIVELPDSPSYLDIKSIAKAAVDGFIEEQYDELYLIYNEFRSALSQVPVKRRLLPLTEDNLGGHRAAYEYEPTPEEVLDALLPRYAETLIYSAILESKASEFGARMTAMGNANKNAGKMIDTLTLQYNRERQASITLQIAEIVGGANALK
ncbi:MAG: F0F1 ATP synthase subunit gamma [Paenibacillaceae bacterium ZCTH02-B3]|nr:MAG: F0F1 ATP synthase subunit gamma [Paenibacillaceae bacterium ZCTH02-B3]